MATELETWRGWEEKPELLPGEVPSAPKPRAADELPEVVGGPRD
jgi:hypothetical protein